MFQRAPELLTDVITPDGIHISRKWVIVGSAQDIERIIDAGGETTIEVGGSHRPGQRDRRRYDKVSVTLMGIVGIRYVNHREHGRTRYLAASVKSELSKENVKWHRAVRKSSS